MPDLGAFRGIRYAAASELRDLVCPPYDVITPEEHGRLLARHPHNAVRIELPFSQFPGEATDARYRRAGALFRSWLGEGVLERASSPCLFVYRQDFARDGGRARVAGVVGALRLEQLGPGSGVLPHERTMPGPVEDRLALLRACPVNISPIYGIYRGRGELAPYLDALAARPTQARFVDDNGTLHRLWSIASAAEGAMLADAVRAGPLVIADGHHRYETALAYRRELGGPGEQDAVMCFCVDADAEDLQVLPYHRGFSTPVPVHELARRIEGAFPCKRLPRGKGRAALGASGARHALLVVMRDEELLVEPSPEAVDDALAGRAEAWRRLDVVVLHEIVLRRVLREGVDALRFSTDAGAIEALVSSGERDVGVILRPLHASDVIEVARSGERMPQKASYFWPKALTGLVFRALF